MAWKKCRRGYVLRKHSVPQVLMRSVALLPDSTSEHE
eukprot:CAMPEP_0168460362 /NCGR_PEP_ID=MMETSP0228-20121227/53405_1 /TAXON_ID=133427 /ORGANISM="Protoceratium reticulatum, Strain CCCM 535 (=CCMP 1889)" /LENGTH=36 /DNA_ID= /DNA_START= /DNA_END= /DNA_ORIENTATION=